MLGFIIRSAIPLGAGASSSRLVRLALLVCLAATVKELPAQSPLPAASQGNRYLCPQKDVAVLVDVSRSVEWNKSTRTRDEGALSDAKSIVRDLIAGRAFDTQGRYYNKRDWTVEPGQDAALNNLFARYLGSKDNAVASAEVLPIGKPGGNLLVLPVGNLSTVLNKGTTTTIKSSASDSLASQVESAYSRVQGLRDTSTCFWFAMARAAEILTEQSRDGYYLFVVSDEEDDPDYRKTGPPGHTVDDYPKYMASLAGTWPENTIRSTIERYFVSRSLNDRNAELYQTRTGFAKTLIARFYRRNASSASNPVSISWYAMGVVPQIIPPPPPAPVQTQAPAIVYTAPKLTPRIQFLGGLGKGKSYDYETPLVAWQVVNGAAADMNEINSTSQLSISGTGKPFSSKLSNSGRRSNPQTMQITGMKESAYQVGLTVPGSAGLAATSLPTEATVQYQPRTDFWLMVLAITSLVAAVGIFFFAWRNLRETRMVAAS